jgi:hypothetical protein
MNEPLLQQQHNLNNTKLKKQPNNNNEKEVTTLLSVLHGPPINSHLKNHHQNSPLLIPPLPPLPPLPPKTTEKKQLELKKSPMSLSNVQSDVQTLKRGRKTNVTNSRKKQQTTDNYQIYETIKNKNNLNTAVDIKTNNKQMKQEDINNNNNNNNNKKSQSSPIQSSKMSLINNNNNKVNSFQLNNRINYPPSPLLVDKKKQYIEKYQEKSNQISPTGSSNSNSSQIITNLDNSFENGGMSSSSAEIKRRFNIQNGFDRLQVLVPSLRNNQSTSRLSKASMLHKTSEYIRELQTAKDVRLRELEMYRKEIEKLNSQISECQEELPDGGVAVSANNLNLVDKFDKKFDSLVKERTIENWKFYLFSLIIKPIFNSYANIINNAKTNEEIELKFNEWQQRYCTLPIIRRSKFNYI